jgi:hypothetical protein
MLTSCLQLWASGYEVYDRLSDPMKKFLEGLTATHDASFFHDEARRLGNPIRNGIRGSPLNQGENLYAVHPLIRTNPVTGWKSVYVNKGFTKRINGLSKDESDTLLAYLFGLVAQNHDAQVRYRWSKNDCAIWDNRSTQGQSPRSSGSRSSKTPWFGSRQRKTSLDSSSLEAHRLRHGRPYLLQGLQTLAVQRNHQGRWGSIAGRCTTSGRRARTASTVRRDPDLGS